MIFWGLIILGSLSCLGSAHTIAHDVEHRGLMRQNPVDAKPMRLVNGQSNGGENSHQQPECIINPHAAMAAHSKGDEVKHSTIYKKRHHLVDEQEVQVHDVLTRQKTHKNENTPKEPEEKSIHHVEEKITTELPEEISTHSEEEKTTTEMPEETSTHSEEEKTTTEMPEETSTHSEEEKTTTEMPEETSTHSEEEKTTTEVPVENTTLTEDKSSSTEAPIEPADQPDEKSTTKAPVEEPKTQHRGIAGTTKHDCKNDTVTLKRKSKAPKRRPNNDEADDEDDEDFPRQGDRRGGSVYRNFFPITFTGAGRSRSRDAADGAGDAGMQGAVIAIANSFSKGRGAVASSSAVANGSPDVSQYRQSRRNSRYRV